MNSTLNSKRFAFRNDIRHKQLEQYFATKRKMLIGDFNMEIEHHSFKNVFQNLMEQRNVDENLSILNGLSFDKQLSQEFQNGKQSEQYYYDIVQFLIRVASEHRSFNKQDVDQRIKCLNTILNLLSDQYCPNSLLAQMICEYLKQFYQSVSSWGFDDQMLEIGFLIANLINKESFGHEAEEECIAYIFEWIEDLLHIKQQKQMTQSIYFGLMRVVVALQNRYKLKIYELPELYQAKIMNFIQITLNNDQICQSSMSGVNLKVANFMYHLVPFILAVCPQEWTQKLVINIFKQLGTLKKSLFKSLCKIIKRILTFNEISFCRQNQFNRAGQIRNSIRMFIVQNFHSKLVIYLTVLQTDMKEQIFEIIVRLIECDKTNSVYFLDKFIELGLQNWMIKAFDIKNQELNILFFELVNVASTINMGDCFKRFIDQAERMRAKTALQKYN